MPYPLYDLSNNLTTSPIFNLSNNPIFNVPDTLFINSDNSSESNNNVNS